MKRRRRHVIYDHVGPRGQRIRILEFTAGRRIGFSLTFWHDQAPGEHGHVAGGNA